MLQMLAILLISLSALACRQSSAPSASTDSSDPLATTGLLPDGEYRVIWLQKVYDSFEKDSVLAYRLDKEFISSAPEPVRAIMAYFAAKAGTECVWEGGSPAPSNDNLKCLLTSALGLSYQCSTPHLQLVEKWFRKNMRAITAWQNCYHTPNDELQQWNLDHLTLRVKGNRVEAEYKYLGMNLEANKRWEEPGTEVFIIENDAVLMADK
jgi:hypothetical protein